MIRTATGVRQTRGEGWDGEKRVGGLKEKRFTIDKRCFWVRNVKATNQIIALSRR